MMLSTKHLLRIWPLFALCCLALAAGAQAPAEETGGDEDLAVYVDQVNVNVVNVEVFVTDKQGNPILGLTQDDFEILENKQPVQITNFYTVESGRRRDRLGAAAEPEVARQLPERRVDRIEPLDIPEDQRLRLIVYIDNFNLRPAHRNRVMGDLRRFIAEQVGPEDQAMLVSYDRSLHVRQPFTSDGRLINAATLELERMSAHLTLRDSERRQAMDQIEDADTSFEALSFARSYAQSVENDMTFALRAMKEMVSSLAGLPGRKAILYVSDGIPMRPGEDLFHAVDQRFPGSSSSIIESFTYDFSRRFRELAAQANANRVTFYTLDATGLQVSASISAEEKGPGIGVLIDSIRESNYRSPLHYLADSTGGRAIVNTNAVMPGLLKIGSDFDNYYSLGYQPSHFGDGRYYQIEVKLKDRKARKAVVRHREGYRDLSTETRMGDGTMAALYHDYEDNPMKVTLGVQPEERRQDGYYVVPVLINIPIGNVTLVPRANTYEARVRLFIAAMDEKGGTSPIQQVTVPISIPNGEVEVAKTKSWVYQASLLMRPGSQRVAVGVRDELSSESSFVSRQLLVGSAKTGRGR